jgi:hypothetical protein
LAKTVLIEESCFLREAASDCILASFNAVGAFSLLVMAYGDGGPQLVALGVDHEALRRHGWSRRNGCRLAVNIDRRKSRGELGPTAAALATTPSVALIAYGARVAHYMAANGILDT